MKKLHFVLIIFAVLTSCEKEEEGPKNYIEYNGQKYELTKGFIQNLGGEHNNWDIILASDLIMVTGEGITGFGNAVYLRMFSSSQTEFAPGVYTYSSSANPLTFNRGTYGINYDYANRNGTSLALVAGTINISLTGSDYTISISSVLASGTAVNAYYSGPLVYQEF